MGTALAALREREPEPGARGDPQRHPRQRLHRLFGNVAAKDGYLRTVEGPIYPLAAAGSFFEQVIPDGRAELGMCSNAAHWLREQPRIAIPDGHVLLRGDRNGARRRSPSRRRATGSPSSRPGPPSCGPGGRLLVQGIASSDDGERVSASTPAALDVAGGGRSRRRGCARPRDPGGLRLPRLLPQPGRGHGARSTKGGPLEGEPRGRSPSGSTRSRTPTGRPTSATATRRPTRRRTSSSSAPSPSRRCSPDLFEPGARGIEPAGSLRPLLRPAARAERRGPRGGALRGLDPAARGRAPVGCAAR